MGFTSKPPPLCHRPPHWCLINVCFFRFLYSATTCAFRRSIAASLFANIASFLTIISFSVLNCCVCDSMMKSFAFPERSRSDILSFKSAFSDLRKLCSAKIFTVARNWNGVISKLPSARASPFNDSTIIESLNFWDQRRILKHYELQKKLLFFKNLYYLCAKFF